MALQARNLGETLLLPLFPFPVIAASLILMTTTKKTDVAAQTKPATTKKPKVRRVFVVMEVELVDLSAVDLVGKIESAFPSLNGVSGDVRLLQIHANVAKPTKV